MVYAFCICIRGRCANNTQTSRSHRPKMTPYRVDQCVVYAVVDMVLYHSGLLAPLMFVSSLLKGMNMCHMRPTKPVTGI